MLCSHFTRNCIFCTFWGLKILVLWRKIVQNLLTFVYLFSPKKQHNWFHQNLHNSGMVGCRKLPDPSLNHIFNAQLIAVQYTPSSELTSFGLNCQRAVFAAFWMNLISTDIWLTSASMTKCDSFDECVKLLLETWKKKLTVTIIWIWRSITEEHYLKATMI